MKKRILKFTIGVLGVFVLLNFLFLFFPLLAGTGGFRRSVISSVESVYNTVSETVSNVVGSKSGSTPKYNNPTSSNNSSETKNDESQTEEEKDLESSSKLVCKIYEEIENEDFKIYEVDGVVRVEVKGDYADSAVDYLRGHGCAPLASGNIVYVINGKEIKL